MNATITLREYIEDKGKGKSFLIPNYQRGYVWGKKLRNKQRSVVRERQETVPSAK